MGHRMEERSDGILGGRKKVKSFFIYLLEELLKRLKKNKVMEWKRSDKRTNHRRVQLGDLRWRCIVRDR